MQAYTPELLARAEAYLNGGLQARREKDGLTEISDLVSAITGEPNGGCRQCQYLDYLRIVRSYTRAARRTLFPETMPESQYAILPAFANEKFVHEGLSEVVTADNLTDETAKFLISKGYGHAIKKKSDLAKQEAPEGEAADNPDLTKEQEAHEATKSALQAEKDAHKATKKELSEVKKQLAAAEKKPAKAEKADEAEKPAPTDAQA